MCIYLENLYLHANELAQPNIITTPFSIYMYMDHFTLSGLIVMQLGKLCPFSSTEKRPHVLRSVGRL